MDCLNRNPQDDGLIYLYRTVVCTTVLHTINGVVALLFTIDDTISAIRPICTIQLTSAVETILIGLTIVALFAGLNLAITAIARASLAVLGTAAVFAGIERFAVFVFATIADFAGFRIDDAITAVGVQRAAL